MSFESSTKIGGEYYSLSSQKYLPRIWKPVGKGLHCLECYLLIFPCFFFQSMMTLESHFLFCQEEVTLAYYNDLAESMSLTESQGHYALLHPWVLTSNGVGMYADGFSSLCLYGSNTAIAMKSHRSQGLCKQMTGEMASDNDGENSGSATGEWCGDNLYRNVSLRYYVNMDQCWKLDVFE